MNAYEKATQLGLIGTDQEILNQMSAMTDTNITRDALVQWLQDNAYWEETPTGMIGDLVAGYTASTGGLRKKFDRVWRWLYKRLDSDVLRTTHPVQSGDVLAVINRISTISNGIRNQYFALGGGATYRATTEVEFAAQRTAAQTAVANQLLRTTKQASLAEANDTCIHLIDDTPISTQAEVLTAFTDRLAATWPA